jgi:NUMOD4 motif/HNH endonuclease
MIEPLEEWRPIDGWDGYEVSNLGRVRSWKQRSKGRIWRADRSQAPHILKQECRGNYLAVLLSEKGKAKRHVNVHRLVLETFVGPPPVPGMQGAHDNGDGRDNREVNLLWKTPAANNADKHRHGTRQHGERAGTAKLCWADAEAIRARRAAGEGVRAVAGAFGVCRNTVINITTGKTWVASNGAK